MELRTPTIEDKEKILEYIEEHHRNGEYELHGSNMLDQLDYLDWLKKLEINRTIGDDIWGISDTFIVIKNEKIVGLLNIRYNPIDEILSKYGNIGYGVRPTERKKGIASDILKNALEKCRNKNMKEIRLGCYKDNIGSIKTIQKNGGILKEEILDGGSKQIIQYYIIKL